MLRLSAKNPVAVYLFALFAALLLCVVFTIGGVTSFQQIIAGNDSNFNDTLFNGLTSVRLLATVGYFCAAAAYIIWLLYSPVHSLNFKQILRLGWPFLALAWIAYPLSSDVYLYLQYGLMALRGVNPHLVHASKLSTVLHPFLYWLHQTSTYGPISQLFFEASARLVRVSPMVAVYGFKIFCLLFHVINAYLIWRLLKKSNHRTLFTMAYLLNPYLLLAHVADAHVDVFLCCSIIILVACLYRQFDLGATLALVAGFLTKTLPIIWLPLVVTFWVRQRRWKSLALGTLACLAIFWGLSQTLFPTAAAWKSLLNPGVSGMTARSFHHLVNLALTFAKGADSFQQPETIRRLSQFTFLGFALYYSWRLVRLYFKRSYSAAALVAELGWVTLVLLLSATPWLMSWYPSVLLPFAVLSRSAPVFCVASLVFCLSSGALIGAGSGDSLLSLLGALFTLAPVIAVLLQRQRATRLYERILARSEQPQLNLSASPQPQLR